LSHTFLADPAFHEFLFQIDQGLAKRARRAKCPSCGGKLHSADYWRRPRGGLYPRGLRFSFCCATEGCRKRRTPGSVRFLGRRVYVGVLVVLLSTLRHGLTPERLERLKELRDRVGVSERTLVRWRQWWLRDFANSGFWTQMRGLFRTPVGEERLPDSLVERFEGAERRRLEATLRFLVPIAGGKGLAGHLF